MLMETSNPKLSLTDLIISIHELNKKYNISGFESEIKTIFKTLSWDLKKINSFIQNEETFFEDNDIDLEVEDISPEMLQTCVNEYLALSKKYQYDKYVKEGSKLRKKFLDDRKTYLFGKMKYVVEKKIVLSDLEKLHIDYHQQHSISTWIDKSLKKMHPDVFTIKYEDTDGKIKVVEAQHHKVEFTEEYVDAPLIDRIIGTTLFDSFLLHSFYDINKKNWVYVPTKLIISIENKRVTEDTFIDDSIFGNGEEPPPEKE